MIYKMVVYMKWQKMEHERRHFYHSKHSYSLVLNKIEVCNMIRVLYFLYSSMDLYLDDKVLNS